MYTLKAIVYFLCLTRFFFIDIDAGIPQSPLDFDDGKRLSNASDKIAAATAAHPEVDDADEEVQNLSLWDIVKLNNAEWPQIFLGCLASFVMGATMPIFAILFGEIIGVITKETMSKAKHFILYLKSLQILADSDDDYIRRKTNEYCLYFVATGIITAISTFLQVIKNIEKQIGRFKKK